MIHPQTRALAYGAIALSFAVALPRWGTSEHSTRIEARPQLASLDTVHAARRGTATAKVFGTRDPEVSSPAVIAGAARAEHTTLSARPSGGAAGSLTDPARRFQGGAGVPIANARAGTKTHAQAMASLIDSEEFKDLAGPLARLYFAYFDRFPDHEGLDYYIGQRERGRALASIADEFAGSREFDMRYGAIDNAAFVDRVYENVYGVPPDATQRGYWLGRLDSGVTRGEVIIEFSEGAAFRALTANEVFVATAYTETLGRTPDPAGFARWVRFLDEGNPREAVVDGLLATRRP